jgi:hypothetical protein
LAALPGTGIPEKIGTVMNFSKVELIDACKQYGACCQVKPGHLVVIPAGQLVVSLGVNANIEFFRWIFLQKSMFTRVTSVLSLLLSAHEHLKDTEYKTIYDIIKSQD